VILKPRATVKYNRRTGTVKQQIMGKKQTLMSMTRMQWPWVVIVIFIKLW
jgi:hypothetical protein